MKEIAAILSFIFLLWMPVGRLYMVWFEFFKGKNWREVIKGRLFKMEILRGGLLGVLTPHFNKKWLQDVAAHKKTITAPGQQMHLEKKAV